MYTFLGAISRVAQMLSSKCRTCFEVESWCFVFGVCDLCFCFLTSMLHKGKKLIWWKGYSFFFLLSVLTVYSSPLPVSIGNLHKPVTSGENSLISWELFRSYTSSLILSYLAIYVFRVECFGFVCVVSCVVVFVFVCLFFLTCLLIWK